MKNLKRKGFTIVELVIVIAVIAVLAAVLIPTFVNLTKKANESSDIQAVRNMNVFLAQAEALGEVDSILDVYEVFEESDYVVENYQPLYKGRYFYYDKQQKQVLYVDENNKVLFPSNLEGTTQGTNDWFSLSMEIKTEAVSDTNGVYTISKASQLAYVFDKLDSSFPSGTVTINITEDIDLQGANIAIAEVPAGSSLVINGNDNKIKNISANTYLTTGEGEDSNRKYTAAGLIGILNGSASISNVIFENINVKDTNAGNVALLIGSTSEKALTISDVTIQNSTVIGHRSVGAVVGMLYSAAQIDGLTLNNVNVQTIAGRSGLVFGFASMGGVNYSINELVTTNSKLTIYECEQNTGEGCSIVDYKNVGVYGTNATKKITSYSIETNGTKEYRTYGFNEKALVCVWNPNKLEETDTHVDNTDNEYRYCYFALN